jgi:opacity protein-like surface antigen
MSRFLLAATLAVAMTPAISFAQAPAKDSAHTLFTPNAPDPGRSGAVVQLPQGGTGVTTGGTANYQTLGTPNGTTTMVPNGGGTSTVIGSGGRGGTVATPR